MLQPTIVKLYKAAGLVALTAILIGLISFLVVNVFYFFDHTWVRPVVLSPTHQKVVEATQQLGDAKLRQAQLKTEKLEIEADLAETDRVVASNEALLARFTSLEPSAMTPDKPADPKDPKADPKTTAPVDPKAAVAKLPATANDLLVAQAIAKAKLDRDNAIGRRIPLKERLAGLAAREDEQNALVGRLAESPYLRARDHKVVLAFVPYQNLKNVKKDTKLYGCSWGLVGCSKVGKITMVLDGEVQDIHPHNESVQRGVMVVIEVTETAANDNVLFAGGKPLWLL